MKHYVKRFLNNKKVGERWLSPKRNNNVKGLSIFGVACISITILLSIIGVGYGYWGNGIDVFNSISTGNMNVSIDKCSVLCEKKVASNVVNGCTKNDVKTTVAICNENNNVINVTIENAYPGYSAAIKYKIKNNGTIPAKYSLVGKYSVMEKNGSLEAQPSEIQPAAILGVGETKEVIITIIINKVVPGKEYTSFPIYLNFIQDNEVD